MPPSIWPSTRQRVERPPDVLRRGDLHDLDQAELGVDVDDGAVGDERERGVAVALPVLVEVLGRPVVVLDGLLEARRRRVASATGTRSAPDRVDDVACRRSPSRSGSMPCAAPTCSNSRSRTGPAGGVDRAAAHPRLARRRRRAGRADRGVDRLEHDLVDAEDGAGDLLGDRDEALADLGGGELQRGHAVGEPAAGRRVVVEALGVHQVLDRHAPADAAADVRRRRRCARRRRAGASGRRRGRRPARRAAAARRSRGCSGRPAPRSRPPGR